MAEPIEYAAIVLSSPDFDRVCGYGFSFLTIGNHTATSYTHCFHMGDEVHPLVGEWIQGGPSIIRHILHLFVRYTQEELTTDLLTQLLGQIIVLEQDDDFGVLEPWVPYVEVWLEAANQLVRLLALNFDSLAILDSLP